MLSRLHRDQRDEDIKPGSEQQKLRDRATGGHRQRKTFIESQEPEHTLFCREIRFVAIYALFRGQILSL